MLWTAWTNGDTGYGFAVEPADFDDGWTTVLIDLPGSFGTVRVEASVAKPSFRKKCPHAIDKQIGLWMRREGYLPWPTGQPPKFIVERVSDRHFRVLQPSSMNSAI